MDRARLAALGPGGLRRCRARSATARCRGSSQRPLGARVAPSSRAGRRPPTAPGCCRATRATARRRLRQAVGDERQPRVRAHRAQRLHELRLADAARGRMDDGRRLLRRPQVRPGVVVRAAAVPLGRRAPVDDGGQGQLHLGRRAEPLQPHADDGARDHGRATRWTSSPATSSRWTWARATTAPGASATRWSSRSKIHRRPASSATTSRTSSTSRSRRSPAATRRRAGFRGSRTRARRPRPRRRRSTPGHSIVCPSCHDRGDRLLDLPSFNREGPGLLREQPQIDQEALRQWLEQSAQTPAR